MHKQTVEALASAMTAKARLDAVFRASPLAFMTLDREGKATGWNATAERIFGWSTEEVIGKSLPFRKPKPVRADPEHHRTDTAGRVDLRRRNETKAQGRFSFRMPPLDHYPPGFGRRFGHFDQWVDDVSIRKRLQEELRFSQKMEAVGRLAGGVAHDFNNLLTAIIGYNGFLADSLVDQPQLLAYARQVEGAAERAAVLTRRLLTFGRRQVSKPKPLNVNHCITNIQNLLTRVIGEDIEIVTNFKPDLGSICLDPVELDQVMMNLAVNARDAMSGGGRLTFETANVKASLRGKSERLVSSPGDYVMVRVRDTGCGMDATTKSRLFEPFFTTKEQGKGTGLGLSIVYGVVQQSGGFITVESEPGTGATFHSVFSQMGCGTRGHQQCDAGSRAPAAVESATVLLVEDEPVVRQLTAAVLGAQGYRILEAGTPAEEPSPSVPNFATQSSSSSRMS